MDRPAIIFRELAIPTYLIWDGDNGQPDANASDNHLLLSLVHAPVEDWPSSVADTYACFKTNLEETIKAEIGAELFETLLAECQGAR